MLNRVRLLVLILGPLPIVGLSLALTSWLRPEAPHGFVANEVLLRSSRAGVAAAAEVDTDAIAEPDSLEQPCRQSAEQWAERLGESCRVIVRSPFVVAGDMSETQLSDWHRQTIAPAARAMANSYFRACPTEPITILLFTGEASYNHYANHLFGESDISIYGYYKPQQRTLVMNIGTGGGTLVHELTHALINFDFPQVPDWFNEGLASLHEQCRFRENSHGPWIEGVENWRLPGLQSAIRKQKLRSLAALISDNDFRGLQEGTNYAEARYFCLFMQRQGVLENFYRAFRKNWKTDPRGAQTVLEMFPGKAWDDLDREFQAWVLTLQRE
jgi:hypothetical protein